MSKYPEIDAVLAGESDGCIICGDCLEVMAEMPDGCVDVMITDPDYGTGRKLNREDALTTVQAEELLMASLTEIKRLSCNPYACLFWSPTPKRIAALFAILGRVDIRPVWMGIWNKPNGPGPAGIGMANRWEPWFWLSWGKVTRKAECRFFSDLICAARIVSGYKEDVGHSTQKPIVLMKRLVQIFSVRGALILDPFCGSGTTCAAARCGGRRYIGIDIDSHWCDVAKDRLLQLDGRRLEKFKPKRWLF